jgi:membrane protease YdiL (CAAX protease family)
VLVIIAALGVGAIVLFVGVAWLFAQGLSSSRNVPIVGAIVIQLVLEGAVVALLLVALPRLSGFSLKELGFVAPQPWQIGVGLLGALVMIVVVEGGASLIQAVVHQQHEQQVIALFKQVRSQPNVMWFFAVFAVIVAPFMEEMIFRVFLFNLGLRYGGFWAGAIVSGIAFGLAHGDLFVLLPLALGGMVLSFVYYRTRNAFCSMVTHGCFNAVTVFALIYAPNLAQ